MAMLTQFQKKLVMTHGYSQDMITNLHVRCMHLCMNESLPFSFFIFYGQYLRSNVLVCTMHFAPTRMSKYIDETISELCPKVHTYTLMKPSQKCRFEEVYTFIFP